MPYLLDTNVLLRRARPSDARYPAARNAIESLVRQGEAMYMSSQNVIEYWNVLTRPAGSNGFGLSPAQADQEVTQLESFFRFLPDTPDVYPLWRRLVVSVGVSGVKVHDARLVAVMMTHGVSHLLTFNSSDFKRFPITTIDPKDV
jgi:predicted nucleic acid-binding protein